MYAILVSASINNKAACVWCAESRKQPSCAKLCQRKCMYKLWGLADGCIQVHQAYIAAKRSYKHDDLVAEPVDVAAAGHSLSGPGGEAR